MRFDRLRQLTAAELRWRAGAAWRTAAERVRVRVTASTWDRRRLLQGLSPDAIDANLARLIREERWSDVQTALAHRITERPARFVLDPASAPLMRQAIQAQWPEAGRDAIVHADRILEGRYDLLGYRGLSFGQPIDWHFDPAHGRRAPQTFWARVPYLDPLVGDHKVIWELNRHQHWMRLGRAFWLTGDRKYADVIRTQLDGWLQSNPPLVGINWASMLEVGFRSLSWTWALHCMLGEPGTTNEPATRSREPGTAAAPADAWLVDLLIGLDRHLTHVERHLSYYFSPNTHLTGEALALYVVGTALPELAGSSRWVETGRRILIDEIGRQILEDGGHAERSTHYQRYTLDFYVLALLTARRAGDADAVRAFEDAISRLADFTRTIADDTGHLPLIGDDDGGMLWPLTGRPCHDVRDSLAVSAAILNRDDLAPWGTPEEAAWLLGPHVETKRPVTAPPETRNHPSAPRSRFLADTGYFVARDGRGGHAVFDAGRHGYLNAGHAHADALAVTLSVEGRPVLIDPGTSTYTMDAALRDRMRSTSSHNTVTLDGRPQSRPAGPFHWLSQACTDVRGHRLTEAFDWIEASHDGYLPARHRRTMVGTAADGWLIADEIVDGGRHSAAVSWHFDPAWEVERVSAGSLRLTHADGTSLWLLHDSGEVALFHGDERTGLGWYAPVYGTLVPTWTARITREEASPFSVVTWIGGGHDIPRLARLDIDDVDAPSIAVRVDHDGRSTVFQLRPGTGAAPIMLAASSYGKELPLVHS